MKPSSAVAPGSGEEIERANRRRMVGVKGALFVVGLFSGGYMGYFLAHDEYDINAPWPTEIAVALAAIYLAAMAIGTVLLHNKIDEVERQRTYKAVAFAGSAYMLVYPVWFLLWKGSIAPEPIHWLLFVGFWLLLVAGAIYYRFR